MIPLPERASRLLGLPLELLLAAYADFVTNTQPALTAWLAGQTATAEPAAWQALQDLRRAVRRTIDALAEHGHVPWLATTEGWELLGQFEAIGDALDLVAAWPTFSRSARRRPATPADLAATATTTITTGRNQTLEALGRELLGDDEQGQALALANDLALADAPNGDIALVVPLPIAAGSSAAQAVLGPPGTMGRDLPARLAFQEDDLTVLDEPATFEQACRTLLSLGRGDDPYLPDLGLERQTLVGQNTVLLGLPVLLRQLAEVLATDDTIAAFRVRRLLPPHGNDQLTIELELVARFNVPTTTQTLLLTP